jgi:hypothetical protein
MGEKHVLNPTDKTMMAADPILWWVPLADGQTCGVLAHEWHRIGDSLAFYVEVNDAGVEGLLRTVSLPTVLCGEDSLVDAALSNHRDILRSPPATKRISGVPEYWDVELRLGPVMSVLAMGSCIEGPYVVFSILLHGWPDGSAPVLTDCLRFPLSLFPDDIDYWITRIW